MYKLLRVTFAAAGLATFFASTAMAQMTRFSGPPPAAGHAQGFENRAFARPTERVEARLAYVKTALKITDAQQSQWDAYANFARRNAKEVEQRIQSRRPGGPGQSRAQRPNAIERLERAQSFHAEAIRRLNELLAVEKPLYAALSPDQKSVADVVLHPRLGRMPGRPMAGRGDYRREL